MTARVLVLGRPAPAQNALVRALWRQGDLCDLGWYGTRWDAALRTRAAHRFRRVPASAARSAESFGAALLELAQGDDYDALVPLFDWETWLVAAHAEELASRVGLCVPTLSAFELANDKSATLAHARSLGLATPRVYDWPGAPDLESLTKEVRFPVVVKARSGSGVHRGLRFAMNRSELRACYEEIESVEATTSTEDFTRPLVMEFIPGFIHDACAVAKDGEVVNMLTQVRQVMAPVQGGVGAVNITTDEPELRAQARRLLESLGWTGPAQVEFKYDPRDGCYKLIELNPRLWGTLGLSIRAGMDFPGQIRDLALGRSVRRDQPYQIGLRQVFLSRALRAYEGLVRAHGRSALKDGRKYARTTLGLELRDPLPELREIASILARLVRRSPGFLRQLIGLGKPATPANNPSGSLPAAHINTLDRSRDPGY